MNMVDLISLKELKKCKSYNDKPYYNEDLDQTFGVGCQNPDHGDNCDGFNTKCCCYVKRERIPFNFEKFSKYFCCIGWIDGDKVSHCINAPCISLKEDFECKVSIKDRHQLCRRKMEAWEFLDFKNNKDIVMVGRYTDNEVSKNDIICRVCKKVLDFGDMVNINDQFYSCKNCVENNWELILDILFEEEMLEVNKND